MYNEKDDLTIFDVSNNMNTFIEIMKFDINEIFKKFISL